MSIENVSEMGVKKMNCNFFIKMIFFCAATVLGSAGIFSKATAVPLSWIDKRDDSTQPPPPDPDPDIFDKLFENPILMALIAVILVLIVVVAVLILKNRKKGTTDESDDPLKNGRSSRGTFKGDMAFNVGNLHHIGQRDEQQDSFCLSDINDKTAMREKGLMAVVADGMGGMEGGAAISQLVADTFIKSYRQADKFEPEEFLYDTAQEAERVVDDYKKRTGINGGSTLVAVIIKAGELHTLSVGDSRIYLLRQGKLKQLNHEHTFGEYLKEKAKRGEVDPEEPYINSKRDALTAFIGIGNFKKVDRGEPIPLLRGDKILLCSDGVFNALSDDAIIATLTGDAFTSAEKMEQAILAQRIPTQDNFTGVILEFK